MGMAHYLAMTAAELGACPDFSGKIAWMGCHFSPYGLGLSNLPPRLPEGSMLILDDITPIRGHDPALICDQLMACIERLHCAGVLLDFQRPGYEESTALVSHLSQNLPCPVAVSEVYGQVPSPAVFLSPVPCHIPLQSQLSPWEGRDIWLETALSSERLTLTEEGCTISPLSPQDLPAEGFYDETLHCHYCVQLRETEASFLLWRTREDLDSLMAEAGTLGISLGVGLYQELGDLLAK